MQPRSNARHSFGFRDELFEVDVGEGAFCDELAALFSCVSRDIGPWRMQDGIYRGYDVGYVDVDNEYHRGTDKTGIEGCKFVFDFGEEDFSFSEWNKNVGSIIVYCASSGSQYGVDLDVDSPQYGERAAGIDGFGPETRSQMDGYVITGRLVDPIFTQNPRVAARHLEEQFEKVHERFLYNYEIERSAANVMFPDNEHVETTNPASVTGVGEKNLKKMATKYGVYSNMLFVEDEGHEVVGTTFSWSYDVDGNVVLEQVKRAVREYERRRAAGETVVDIAPFELSEYPRVGAHSGRHSCAGQHKHSTAYSHSNVTNSTCKEVTSVCTVEDELHVSARQDGHWILSMSGDQFIVPFGCEGTESKLFERKYSESHVVARFLSLVSRVRQDESVGNLFVSSVPAITDTAVESAVRDVVKSMQVRSPSVRDSLNSFHKKKMKRTEDRYIAYLLSSVPQSVLADDWDISYSVGRGLRYATFSYQPCSTTTSFLRAVNTIKITYEDGLYMVSSPLDSIPEQRLTVSELVACVSEWMKSVERVVDKIVDVQRAYGESDSVEDILVQFKGIGSSTVSNLAEQYETYEQLVSSGDFTEGLSHHYQGGRERIISELSPALA